MDLLTNSAKMTQLHGMEKFEEGLCQQLPVTRTKISNWLSAGWRIVFAIMSTVERRAPRKQGFLRECLILDQMMDLKNRIC
jgi:hypothetical protein